MKVRSDAPFHEEEFGRAGESAPFQGHPTPAANPMPHAEVERIHDERLDSEGYPVTLAMFACKVARKLCKTTNNLDRLTPIVA